MDKVLAFWNDEEGATAVEYGIIAGLMAVVLVAIFGNGGTFGGALKDAFKFIEDSLPGGAAAPGGAG